MLDTFHSVDRRTGETTTNVLLKYLSCYRMYLSHGINIINLKKEKYFTVHFAMAQMILRSYKFSLQMPNQIYSMM